MANAEAIEKFLKDNPAVDDRAAANLRNASVEVQLSVLERGNLTDCTNPSAALMTRIRGSSGVSVAASGLSAADLQGDPADAWARICAKNNIASGGQNAPQPGSDPMAVAQQQITASQDWVAQQQMAYLQVQQQQQLAAQQQMLLLQYQQQQMAAMAQQQQLLPQAPEFIGADGLACNTFTPCIDPVNQQLSQLLMPTSQVSFAQHTLVQEAGVDQQAPQRHAYPLLQAPPPPPPPPQTDSNSMQAGHSFSTGSSVSCTLNSAASGITIPLAPHVLQPASTWPGNGFNVNLGGNEHMGCGNANAPASNVGLNAACAMQIPPQQPHGLVQYPVVSVVKQGFQALSMPIARDAETAARPAPY